MRSTQLLAQTSVLKTQNLLDDLMVLKGSLMTSKEKPELIDIVSNGIFFLENMKKDLMLVEKNITQPKSRTDVLSSPGSANRETQRRLDE